MRNFLISISFSLIAASSAQAQDPVCAYHEPTARVGRWEYSVHAAHFTLKKAALTEQKESQEEYLHEVLSALEKAGLLAQIKERHGSKSANGSYEFSEVVKRKVQDVFLSFHGKAFNGWYPRRTRTETCLLSGDPKLLDPKEKCKVSSLRFPGDPLDVIADDTRFGHPEKVRRTYVILGEHSATASICTTYDYRDYDREDAYVVSRVYEPTSGKFDHVMPFQTCSEANLLTKAVSTEQKPFMAKGSRYRTLANFLETFRDVPKECAVRVKLTGKEIWEPVQSSALGGPEVAQGTGAPRYLFNPRGDASYDKQVLKFTHSPD